MRVYLVLLAVIFGFVACSRLRPDDSSGSKSASVPIEAAKSQWNSIPSTSALKAEACGLKLEDVASEGGGNTSIRVKSTDPSCDPLSDSLRPVTLHHVHRLVSERPTSIIRIDIYPPQHRGGVREWAAFLRNSTEWQKRPKLKNRWDVSEYELIGRLLKSSDPFSPYGRPLEELGYLLDSVSIEKVDHSKLKDWPDLMSTVTGLGFGPEDRLPLPLSLRLIYARRAL